jgi:hypothetical protein
MKKNPMNIKPIQAKLKLLLLGVLCASALNLPALAQNKVVTSSTTEPGPASYHDTVTEAALRVTGSGVLYDGTDITLTATTTNNNTITGAAGKGAYVQNQAALFLTGGSITTIGSYGTGIYLTGTSSGTVNNVNIETKGNNAYGVSATNASTLTLTGGTITTGSNSAYGIYLNGTGSITVSNVNIETKGVNGYGVYATGTSTLTLTGGSITTGGTNGYGIYLTDTSSGTVRDVNIETKGNSAYGVYTASTSALTLSGGTITTGSSSAHGIYLAGSSSGTVSNVNIETKGASGHGVYATGTSALTLTDSDISATGSNANALYLATRSSGTVSLNHNTITGNILASGTSTLTLSGSDGTVLTGNVTGTTGATIGITLSGEGSKFVGNVTRSADSTITLDISDGATLGDAATANTINGEVTIKDGGHLVTTLTLTNGITLEAGAVLDYAGNSAGLLVKGGAVTVSDGIMVDFGGVTVEAGDEFIVLDWNGATLSGSVSETSFTAANLGADVDGSFTVTNNQLIFTANAVPEPSVYFLIGTGLGILLLTAYYRRRKARS